MATRSNTKTNAAEHSEGYEHRQVGEWPKGPGTNTEFSTCHGNLGS